MLSPPEQHHHQNPLTHLLENISSYDGNVMLAAVISLLLVILFVLLLHIYAKWFLQRAQHRRRRRRRRRISSRRSGDPSMSNVLRPGRFHHFQNFPFDNNINSQGLEPSTIASIPLFVYSPNNDNVNNGNDDDGGHDIECLECVVCLSVFEDSDVCRCLPKCGHSFHVECIDMWLHSHTNCPICRAPVVPEKTVAMEVHDHPLFFTDNNDDNSVETGAELVEIVVVDQQARESNCEINEHDQIQDVGFLKHDSSSSSSSPSSSGSSSSSSSGSSSSSSSSSLGSSLKRMLSRNSRSDHQTKAFPSTDNSNNTNLELGD